MLVYKFTKKGFSGELELHSINFYLVADNQSKKFTVIQNNHVEERARVIVDVYAVGANFRTCHNNDVLEVKRGAYCSFSDKTLEYCSRVSFLVTHPVRDLAWYTIAHIEQWEKT